MAVVYCSSVFPLAFILQAEQLGKVERWAVLEGEDLAAALQQYPAAAGGCPLVVSSSNGVWVRLPVRTSCWPE